MSSTETVAPIQPSADFPPPSDLPLDKLDFPTDTEIEAILPNVELVESDGENMDSEIHRMNMDILLDAVDVFFQGRNDYHAGGNSFIYYSTEQARHRDFKGPDFFFVKDVPREPPRRYWCVWEEQGRYPDVIIELLSPSTRRTDLTTKKSVYEKTFHTGNYFCFDPFTQEFVGWKLERPNGYVELKPSASGQLWCDELKLWLGVWEGAYRGLHLKLLRFFAQDGQVVPIAAELAEAAQREAETAQRGAAAAKHEADAAKHEADAAHRRAEAAETELARLRALLAEQGKPST